MSCTEDVKKVLEDMGLDFKEERGEITVDGVPAAQYLAEHDIFVELEIEVQEVQND